MKNESISFKCLLCKKYRSHAKLETVFDDGSFMCTVCCDEVRGAFTYYVAGKEVNYSEFKEMTKKKEEE